MGNELPILSVDQSGKGGGGKEGLHVLGDAFIICGIDLFNEGFFAFQVMLEEGWDAD